MVATTGKALRPISGPSTEDEKLSTASNIISTRACSRVGTTFGLRPAPMKRASIRMLDSHADSKVLVTANCIRFKP